MEPPKNSPSLTQRRIFEYLAPVKCEKRPRTRAEVLQDSPLIIENKEGETIDIPTRFKDVRWTGGGSEESVKETTLDEVPEVRIHPDTETEPNTRHLTAPSMGEEGLSALVESSRGATI